MLPHAESGTGHPDRAIPGSPPRFIRAATTGWKNRITCSGPDAHQFLSPRPKAPQFVDPLPHAASDLYKLDYLEIAIVVMVWA